MFIYLFKFPQLVCGRARFQFQGCVNLTLMSFVHTMLFLLEYIAELFFVFYHF